MFIVYILYSNTKDRYFIGCSENMQETLEEHNRRGFGGLKGDWRLIYEEQFEQKIAAERRAKELKYNKNKKSIEDLLYASRSR